MPDTLRDRSYLAAAFHDNSSADISPQDQRDFLISTVLRENEDDPLTVAEILAATPDPAMINVPDRKLLTSSAVVVYNWETGTFTGQHSFSDGVNLATGGAGRVKIGASETVTLSLSALQVFGDSTGSYRPQIVIFDTVANIEGHISLDAASNEFIIGSVTSTFVAFRVSNNSVTKLSANSFSPYVNDGLSLGDSTLQWSDLFVASGGVINFSNGDVTITHASNKITVAGGTLDATLDSAALATTQAPGTNNTTIATTAFVAAAVVAGGSGDVTAAVSFGVDNRLIRADGTGKGVQHSNIIVDDSANITGINSLIATAVTAGDAVLYDTGLQYDAATATIENIGGTLKLIATSIELGHATANTLTASSGVLSIEGVAIPTISSTHTLTNKRIQQRITTITSSATPTYNVDTCDQVLITALAANITSMTSGRTGTPANGDFLFFQILATGADRAIVWGADFEDLIDTLPVAAILGKRLLVGCRYDSVAGKYGCIMARSEDTVVPGIGNAAAALYQKKFALLEPLAIECLLVDAFSYAVSDSIQKWLISSWQTKITGAATTGGDAGRIDVRDPNQPLPLRGLTLAGLTTGSSAYILDPALVETQDNPVEAYYERINALDELVPHWHGYDSAGVNGHLFLPGPYGTIVKQVTGYDVSWLYFKSPIGTIGHGINTMNEINDHASLRFSHSLLLPISVQTGVTEAVIGNTGLIDEDNLPSAPGAGVRLIGGDTGDGTHTGGFLYYILPDDWGTVADPVSSSYLWQDDFMGASLDTTTKWTRYESTGDNFQINEQWHWCVGKGTTTFGNNTMVSKTGHSRAANRVLVCDVFVDPYNAGHITVGWLNNSGASHDYTDFACGVMFGNDGNMFVFENGSSRTITNGNYYRGNLYRLRITARSDNTNTVEIQGGAGSGDVPHPPIGGSSWTTIAITSSSNSSSPVYPAWLIYNGTANYLGNVRVY